MKITSTWLLTSAAQVIITIAFGAFMIINAAVIGFYVFDGYSNYQKKQAADVILTGRVHKFSSLEFTTKSSGTMRTCVAVTASNGRTVIRELSNWDGTFPEGDFCWQLFSANNLANWKTMAPTSNGSRFIENLLWSIAFFIVFMGGAYLVASIPANLIGIGIPGLAPYAKLMAWVFSLPVLLFWAVFVSNAWQYHPSYWKSPMVI